MIDWHSHILPRMDDGSHSVAESLFMLRAEADQGVEAVVATPHFYANEDSVESFLDRRSRSLEALKAELYEGSIEIRVGAEVRYYQGISRMAELDELRIDGTKLLLLEMPMCTWTEYMIRELTELAGRSSIKLVLAHIERYLGLQKRAVWDRIYESGALAQVNASYFTAFTTKRRAISLLGDGKIAFIGSDCHNMTSRTPNLGSAYEVIRKKLGEDFVKQMNEYGHSVLEKINN